MKPAPKTKEMEATCDFIANLLYGRTRTDSIVNNVCVICGQKVEGFRDALSQKEFTISGMCQECQDSVFGKD